MGKRFNIHFHSIFLKWVVGRTGLWFFQQKIKAFGQAVMPSPFRKFHF